MIFILDTIPRKELLRNLRYYLRLVRNHQTLFKNKMALNKKQVGWIIIILGLAFGTFGVLRINWKIIIVGLITTIAGIILKSK